MQKLSTSSGIQQQYEASKIVHFSLPGLLQDELTLALGIETRIFSLLGQGPLILHQVQFSDTELLVFRPILEIFPYCCPYEVLLASVLSPVLTQASISQCRLRLQDAQNKGTWTQELRPVRRALSSLRAKLHDFNLEISTVRERGCSLTSLKTQAPSLQAVNVVEVAEAITV